LKEFLGKNFKAAQASSEDQAQTDLFKGICQTIIYAVKRNTCLLLIDDFHWIDQQTLQFFNYVIKSLGNIPILIVGALRQEELNNRKEKNSPQELLQKMRENKLLEEISLLHLEKEDVLNMVTVIFPQLKISQDLVDIVYDIGAGNPLFTEELLRSLVSKGFIFYQDGLWQARGVTQASLPPFLKEAVQKRVIELDEEAKPVVAAAAVVGEVFDFNILCQLLEKDSGYVLEVIDRVVKQHLIVPEGPFQTDKFKFKSGVIRDVIYTGLETQKKQQLHRKLAQLEEKMHPDNIDSVAGTIGYHFDKAQDKDRASLYSNMLLEKATRMPTYDDVFNFLQQSMLERVEEIVVPLSDPGMKLIPAAIRSLRLAAQNVRLYPPQSTVRNNFIQQAHKWLSDILDKDSTLIISTAENRLLVNGEEISEKSAREAGSAAFVALMINQRIKSITFKRNLTKEHLDIFLGYLSENYDKLMAEGGLSGILHKNEIEQIKVNEVRYEQTTKLTKQRTKFEEAMLIDYLLGKVSNIDQDKTELAAEIANDPKKLAQALKKVAQAAKAESGKDKTQAQANIIAKGLQKLSEQVLSQTKGGIEQYRKNIAEAMMALDYKVRSKVLAVQAEAVKTGSGDTAKAETKQASEQEILNKLSQEYSGSSDNLANVRQLMQRSLDPKRKQELLPRIKTELAGQGMGEEEISWVLEEAFWPGMSTEQKVQKAVKLSNDNYQKLQNQVSQEVQHLVAELLESGKYDQAREIIHKLIKQLESETQKLRSISLRDLKKITEMLIAKEKYFLLEEIINGLLPRLDQEKDPQIYSSCAEVLADISVTLIKRQSFIQASGILRELNLRLQNESKLLQIQKQAIRETKDKIIAQPALIDWLIKLLQTKIENRQEFWELCKVFGEIGQGSCAPLFSLAVCQDGYADPFSVYARRWGIAKVFNELKEEAVVYLKEKLNPQDQEAVKAAVELLGHLQNKNALQYLQPLVKAEDASIRKETVVAIGKIGGPEAIKLLSESVKDKDKAVRLACVWALANIGTKQALPLLKLLLQEEEFSQEIRKIIQRIEQKDK
ncbi:MAG: HEAT repeat domain-containing protein, partial [Candidatus Omnitrophica bacterium]|nr:HEAT repeat domain-containing protein [Candidatus Omnitrophota bacterium]